MYYIILYIDYIYRLYIYIYYIYKVIYKIIYRYCLCVLVVNIVTTKEL